MPNETQGQTNAVKLVLDQLLHEASKKHEDAQPVIEGQVVLKTGQAFAGALRAGPIVGSYQVHTVGRNEQTRETHPMIAYFSGDDIYLLTIKDERMVVESPIKILR